MPTNPILFDQSTQSSKASTAPVVPSIDSKGWSPWMHQINGSTLNSNWDWQSVRSGSQLKELFEKDGFLCTFFGFVHSSEAFGDLPNLLYNEHSE
jgi:hypothetical protein